MKCIIQMNIRKYSWRIKMITAYLQSYTTQYEGEEIEINYAIFENDNLIIKNQEWLSYTKPTLVGLEAVLALLKKLDAYKLEEIKIIINDPVLYEQINGTSTTRNSEVIKLVKRVFAKLAKYKNEIQFTDASIDEKNRKKFYEILA